MKNLAIAVIVRPDCIAQFSEEDWMTLLDAAYASLLVPRIYLQLQQSASLSLVPAKVLWQLESAIKRVNAHQQDVAIEIRHINSALKMSGVRPIYLKGAAYQLAKDDAQNGRIYSDIDIYVPKERLPAVENALKWRGWVQEQLAPYDEAYYRRWMHEIPPFVNRNRGTTLDVHHNLIPLTARYATDARLLEKHIDQDAQVLGRCDRLLHSIIHLFMETDFEKAVRDLSDMDLFFRQYGNDEDFLPDLLTRAHELGVQRLVFYALRYLCALFETPISQDALVSKRYEDGPGKVTLAIMDWMCMRALAQPLALDKGMANQLAHLGLFIRGHWLKMPLHLLIYHSLSKLKLNIYSWFVKKPEQTNT